MRSTANFAPGTVGQLEGGVHYIEDCMFIDNVATGLLSPGGAIIMGNTITYPTGNLTITRTTFRSNQVRVYYSHCVVLTSCGY
jgi:hypothetical protein